MKSPQDRVAAYVKRISERDGIGAREFGDMLTASTMPHIRTLLPVAGESAVQVFSKALSSKLLTHDDDRKLRVIVLPTLRPVFDIVNQSYERLPSAWEALNQRRSAIEPLIRGVGRIDLTGHPSSPFAGTGFVCSPTCIVTNRHVAQTFVDGIEAGGSLKFLPGVACALSLWQEVASTTQVDVEMTAPITVLTNWDVAVLRVAPLPPSVVPLPLASSAPAESDGGDAAIIGYPAFDPSESFTDQATLFRNVFDKKRLQPGKLNGRVTVDSFGKRVSALAHDCSTLGGNSGSALVSIASAQVAGIHFAGTTHVSNYAVPVWELTKEPLLSGLDFNFV